MINANSRSARPNGSRGFALVITVALLAFLVVLMVSLISLTRISFASSSDHEKAMLARQHALLALDIAVGQLQQTAGIDRCATATAEAFVPGNHYSGVWDASSTGAEPITWLVSGNEGPNLLAITPSQTSTEAVELVGVKTTGRARDVVAPLQAIRSTNFPGQAREVVTGNYAWWVGDQGVKAQITTPDHRARLTYAPYSELETRLRSHQQVSLGAGPAGIEPRSEVNALLAEKIFSAAQLAFYQRDDGEKVGLATVRENFHVWSPGNFAVLANSLNGGLRSDLSLRPSLLGSAFAAWANFGSYMEDPALPVTPAISPAFPTPLARSGIRRRYHFSVAPPDAGISHRIAPVLSHFLLTFNLRTDQSISGANRPLEARARWMVSLWNPYSSALLPEDLQLEVSGLPEVQVINDSAGGVVAANVPLDTIFGAPLKVSLPWVASGRADQQSWLPGRTYSWTSNEELNKAAAVPAAGFPSQFYVKNFNVAGQGVQRVASIATLNNSAQCHLLAVTRTHLILRLYRTTSTGRDLMRTFNAPEFAAFSTTPAAANSPTYQFSFFFRLQESIDTVTAPETWLTTAGQDPREAALPAGSYLSGANGNRPELYANFSSSSFPDRLLDRSFPVSSTSSTGQSFNEDTPLFELPRSPILSLGGLQHLHVTGARPFAIGNSWGGAGGWNALFDRFFFSGVTAQTVLPELSFDTVLPNTALKFLARPTGRGLDRAEFLAHASDGFSSADLLQGAAFNLNSTQRDAWIALLRSGRFVGESRFTALNPAVTSGTAADNSRVTLDLPGATFFRFSQSAQETARATAGYAASTNLPPSAPNVASLANTHLFRNGIRQLTEVETARLAEAITVLIGDRIHRSGPFRSVEEFLNPSADYASARGAPISLLEKAIELSGLNTAVSEFSSQWLTQADLMTVLAPVLFTRSDTFLVRTFGESINPVTSASEARIWAEAIVQRFPEYVDRSQPAETAPELLNEINRRFGRRFKIVSFRWLTASDI